MGGYNDDISTTLENSRNSLRRIGRHNDTEFSKESVLKDMERFVKTVNAMDETVLVPCRLMDLAPSSGPAGVDDLFRLYSMLNEVKIDLLWARGDDVHEPVPRAAKRLPRRASAASVASTVSGSTGVSLDSDSEASCGDSGVEAAELEEEVGGAERAARAAAACRRHLRGLRRSLRQLTTAAECLTQRYQEDVGAPVWAPPRRAPAPRDAPPVYI